MDAEFKGKTIAVTGAANGIGRAIACRFASAGARILAVDVDLAMLEALATELGKERVSSYRIDCMDRAAVEAGFAAMQEEHPVIDVLVNNVGQSARERASLFHETRPEVWDFVIGICLSTTLNVTRQVVTGMRERRSGKIINISSEAAFTGESRLADYSAAKAGILGFTRGLAAELAPLGINVNAICPGVTRTRAIMANPPSVIQPAIDATPRGVMTEPEDIANVAAFLASEQSRAIIGQAIVVGGGRVMQ